MPAFWEAHKLTGDNSRERPYTNLHPRLTVRSNTYQLHFIVQSISKARSTPENKFVPEQDLVTGEKRGRYLLERFINPNDPNLPDYATDAAAGSLEKHYQYRITNRAEFSP